MATPLNSETISANLELMLGNIGRGWSTETINTRNSWLRRIIEQLEQYAQDEMAIRRNEHLAPAGKDASIRTLAEKLLPNLTWLKNLTGKHESLDQNLRRKLFAVASPVTDLHIREQRNAEARMSLRELDQAERDRLFLEACQDNRDELLDAMTTSPLGPMVSPEIRERGLVLRAERQSPNEYKAFEQNELLLGIARMLSELLGRRLAGVGVSVEKVHAGLGILLANEHTNTRGSVTQEQLAGASK